MDILNIAAYRFFSLHDDASPHRDAIEALACEGELLGTVLLAPEGINLFLAGAETSVRVFLEALGKLDARYTGMRVKESWSETVPFKKLRVRVKRELITSGRPDLGPGRGPQAPHLPPERLARWLDEGRDVLLLDTRNAFEVEMGTFEGATHLDLESFSALPEASKARLASLKSKPVVMFCTGGIRCEKAGAMLVEQGFKQVYQLEDGILGYFERVGGRHWAGTCFVFDERIALDPELNPCPEP